MPYARAGARPPRRLVDLSVGTPVDPTPARRPGRAARRPPTPPATRTRRARRRLRQACDRLAGPPRRRRRGLGLDVRAADDRLQGARRVAAASSSGVGPGDLVGYPGARLPDVRGRRAARRCRRSWPPTRHRRSGPRTSRPGVAQLAVQPDRPGAAASTTCARWSPGAASAARSLVSDECYLECAWDGRAGRRCSHPDVNGGSLDGILAVHSLSKRSNLAGYRCGVRGRRPGAGRRAARGPQEPRPDDARPAAGRDGAALDDDAHVEEQRARYAARRAGCGDALEAAGFRIDHSEASLYLWATRDEPCWTRSPGWPSGASWSRRVTSTARRAPARPGRAHRDRRAGRRRGRPPLA